MSLSVEQVSRLIDVVRDASLGRTFAERMEAITEAFSRAIPLDQVHSYTCDRREWQPSAQGGMTLVRAPGVGALDSLAVRAHYFQNYDLAMAETYVGEFAATDNYGHAMVLAGVGKVLPASHYVSDADYRRGRPGYGAFMRHSGTRHAMGTVIPLAGDLRLHYAPTRFPGRSDFSRDEQRALSLLLPHLARAAAEILTGQSSAGAEQDQPARAGLAAFDAKGRVVQADTTARWFLAGLDEAASLTLAEAVVNHLAVGAPGDQRLAFRCSDGSCAVATISRLAARPSRARAVVLFERPTPGTLGHAQAEAGLHGLTHREREVAVLAVQGFSQQQIADRLGLSLPTTKVHLGRCYRKVDVSGQAELAARLLGVRAP